MSARPGPRGGYRVSGIPTAIAVALRRCSNLKRRKTKENCPSGLLIKVIWPCT